VLSLSLAAFPNKQWHTVRLLSLDLEMIDTRKCYAVIMCIAKEIPQRSHEINGFREGQMLEVYARV
jgi:hypothetical protein